VFLLVGLLAGSGTAHAADVQDAREGPRAAASRQDAAPDKQSLAVNQDDDDDQEVAGAVTAIVVTGRRLDAARTSIDRGLGATVYELQNETIESRPGGETGSIAAILSQTPGATLSNSGLTVRGSAAVQVRINDVIVPEAIADPADQLSSRLAETTRLITGALPAQFGFAPGGVIAVTTKNGLYQHGGQAELFVGSGGMVEPAFEWGGSADASSVFASGSLEEGETRVASLAGPTAKDIRRETGGLLFADHVIDPENRVSMILGGSSERQKIGETTLPAGVQRTRSDYALGTLQHSAETVSFQVSVFAADAESSADFARVSREWRGSIGAQVDSSFDIGADNTLRAGLLLTRSTAREQEAGVDRTRRTSLGLYAADEWKPGPDFTVNAGLRADWLRRLRPSPVVEPRISLVWDSSRRFTAHAGYARYASAPALAEEPANDPLPDERDDYFDLGGQQKLGPLTIGVDAYFRTAHDLISEHSVPGAATARTFEFVQGRFHGVGFSAAYARGAVNAWANLSLSKAQGRTIIGGSGLFPPSTLADAGWIHLASDRPVTASAGIGWRIGKLTLSGDLVAGSGGVRTLSPPDPNGARASAFATFGIAAVYHLQIAGRPLDLRADLTNLADAQYLENDAANLEGGWTQLAQGRAILIGVEQGF
jgi:hypothetical protein